jgi:ACS family tartrate transporter-like MFS transporter
MLSLRWISDSPEEAAWLSREERDWVDAEISRETTAQVARSGERAAWRDPRLWIASACWFGLMAGANALLYWLPQILKQLSASSTELRIGFLTALPWIAVAAGMLINAWHSDRAQERHWHVGLAALASSVLIAGTAMLGTGVPALLVLLLAALAMGAAQSTFWTLPSQFLAPASLAPGFAVINMCGNVAGLVIPVFIGWMRHRTGSFDGPVFAIAALMLLAAGAVGLLRARSIIPPYSR